jgi:hypothetical protein
MFDFTWKGHACTMYITISYWMGLKIEMLQELGQLL